MSAGYCVLNKKKEGRGLWISHFNQEDDIKQDYFCQFLLFFHTSCNARIIIYLDLQWGG